MICFSCPTCRFEMKVKDELLNTAVRCPECGERVREPGATAVTAPGGFSWPVSPRLLLICSTAMVATSLLVGALVFAVVRDHQDNEQRDAEQRATEQKAQQKREADERLQQVALAQQAERGRLEKIQEERRTAERTRRKDAEDAERIKRELEAEKQARNERAVKLGLMHPLEQKAVMMLARKLSKGEKVTPKELQFARSHPDLFGVRIAEIDAGRGAGIEHERGVATEVEKTLAELKRDKDFWLSLNRNRRGGAAMSEYDHALVIGVELSDSNFAGFTGATPGHDMRMAHRMWSGGCFFEDVIRSRIRQLADAKGFVQFREVFDLPEGATTTHLAGEFYFTGGWEESIRVARRMKATGFDNLSAGDMRAVSDRLELFKPFLGKK